MEVLADQSRPLSLPEILPLLPAGFPDRTVRRWLAEFVDAGLVVRTGRRRATRYEKRRTDLHDGIFSPAASEAVAHVRQPLFARRPVAYNFDWFDGYHPNSTSYFGPARLAALAEQGRHRFDHEPAGTYARQVYNRLLIDLSYNSSRLEGNTYSLIDTERLVLEGTRADGKLDEEMVMILNHKEAIRHLVDNAARLEVDYDQICTLHYLLSDGLVPVSYAGKIRDHGVRVGGSTYVPLENAGMLASAVHHCCCHRQPLRAKPVPPRPRRVPAGVQRRQQTDFEALREHTADQTQPRAAVIQPCREGRLCLGDDRCLRTERLPAAADLYYASYVRKYEATAEAIGFDEIRVRYRQQRRDAVGTIVNEVLTGTAADEFLAQAVQTIPTEHRDSFVEDVKEDLDALSPHRIAGLAVSQRQLQRYLAVSGRETPAGKYGSELA